MIQRKELTAKAKEFEIHISNVERDYVFGWFLFGLFTASDLKDSIFLKWGNALRKWYFPNTRFSSDIDLWVPNDISQDLLASEINKVCDFIETRSGIAFVQEDNIVKEKFRPGEEPIPWLRVYEARVYFKDFQGGSDHLKIRISMDVTRFDKVLLPIQTVKLIHPYSDASEVDCEIRCMKIEEIIATKLKCLLQRQHAPDLFDYVYSVRLLWWNLNKIELARTFIQKTIFGKNPHVVKEILSSTPFEYFREFWDKTVICTKSISFGVEEAIGFFLTDLIDLFKSFPENSFRQFVFFDANLRIPIMKAGKEQTLLRIRYHGFERYLEPYSLKYQEKKNGEQSEYFYAYDRTWGSTGPGPKKFLARDVQSIENTEEKFEPRYPIGLSKAGELPENPYLFDPNKPIHSPKRKPKIKIGMKTYGPTYIYQCSFCGKKFHKKTMDSKINQHKNKSWYACYGWYGIYVGTKY